MTRQLQAEAPNFNALPLVEGLNGSEQKEGFA